MSTSKISVDLKQRTFSIEVPDDRVEVVLKHIEALFKSEVPVEGADGQVKNGNSIPVSPIVQENFEEGSIEEVGNNGGVARSKKRTKGGGKVRSFEPTELPLSSDQRQELRTFFEGKSPRHQNDTVAVLSVKLKELLGKQNFSVGEILSAIRIVNVPAPKNLPAVFGNMKNAGISSLREGELVVSYLTEDHVNHHMGKKAKE